MDWELDRIDTPALIVDLDIVDANLTRQQQAAQAHGLQLWPHTKTHKSTWLAQKQLTVGAAGLTVAKLGEAEVMRAAGMTNLLVAYPLVGCTKSDRLAALLEKGASVRVAIDSPESADTVADAARRTGVEVGILVEVDTGFRRVGLPSSDAILALARCVADRPFLRFDGLTSFAGHISAAKAEDSRREVIRQEATALAHAREALERAGLPPAIISVGGTHHGARMDFVEGATEIRPGTYIYNDRNTLFAGSCSEADCAASLLVTVVSTHDTWAVIDGGSKTFTMDPHLAGGYGLVVGRPEITFERMSEEHGMLTWPQGGAPLRIGERLRIIPNHICPVVNLQDVTYGVRQGHVERIMTVDGRGRSQ